MNGRELNQEIEAALDCVLGEEPPAVPVKEEHEVSETDTGLSSSNIKEEIAREKYNRDYRGALKMTVFHLAVVAAVAIILANTLLPVMQIYGISMTPTVSEGEVIIAVKGSDFETGDIVSLWYGNKLLVKRVIAGPGQWVDITSDGTVLVDKVEIEEPYVKDKALGDCNIKLPYQVPENKYFVMGDHRSTSQDSRNSAIGCIAKEQIVGSIWVRIWPLNRLGKVNN